MKNSAVFVVFLLVFCVGAFFRFWLITEIPLGLFPDEAMNGNNAREALETRDFKVFYTENNGREGLFINIQAISLALFGNEPWALRMVSAAFGTATIIAFFLLTYEMFFYSGAAASAAALARGAGTVPPQGGERRERVSSKSSLGILNVRGEAAAPIIALLSSFFLAASFWHINFSRIGFRAILVPFFSAFAMYFLLTGLRRGNAFALVWAGIFAGLGFHTYIAFRFMPFVFAVPIVWHARQWWKRDTNIRMHANDTNKKQCAPCLAALFTFITFIAALPIGWYFLNHSQDFFGRTGQVSVLSAEAPLVEFMKSNLITAQMFFFAGDCNGRHNYACMPELHPIVAAFFLVGLWTILRRVFKKTPNSELPTTPLLLSWLLAMSLPATLTREGLPHALRAIGMIPPVMILAGFGAWTTLNAVLQWFEKQKEKFPQHLGQLMRIRRELGFLLLLVLVLIPLATYRDYFQRWAFHPNTYFAFSTDVAHIGEYLAALPQDIKKIVVTELPLPELTEVGTPAQTVMFLTDSYTDRGRREKNIDYLTRGQIENLSSLVQNQKTTIALFNGNRRELIKNLQKKFPELRVKVPGDFVVLESF
ncbi:MAG: glycosyltransferase family 39 protein [Candidatus Sungbacteria bacterium]|nr:glycosyltransferase family 39 protein [Candidatus Sungbacteria bacterium]